MTTECQNTMLKKVKKCN